MRSRRADERRRTCSCTDGSGISCMRSRLRHRALRHRRPPRRPPTAPRCRAPERSREQEGLERRLVAALEPVVRARRARALRLRAGAGAEGRRARVERRRAVVRDGLDGRERLGGGAREAGRRRDAAGGGVARGRERAGGRDEGRKGDRARVAPGRGLFARRRGVRVVLALAAAARPALVVELERRDVRRRDGQARVDRVGAIVADLAHDRRLLPRRAAADKLRRPAPDRAEEALWLLGSARCRGEGGCGVDGRRGRRAGWASRRGGCRSAAVARTRRRRGLRDGSCSHLCAVTRRRRTRRRRLRRVLGRRGRGRGCPRPPVQPEFAGARDARRRSTPARRLDAVALARARLGREAFEP